MRYDEVRAALRRRPFEPFRVILSSGNAYEIRHPEFALVTRTSLFVGEPSGEEIPERLVPCDLLHVTTIEPVNGSQSG